MVSRRRLGRAGRHTRPKGDWCQQVNYAATGGVMLVGKLQVTAVGNPARWRDHGPSDARQYITAYARLDVPLNL